LAPSANADALVDDLHGWAGSTTRPNGTGAKVTGLLALESSLNWWTDVVVPLLAALIGGTAALIGAWLGAKWAAGEQRKHAALIDAERRRARLQSEAILRLDEILDQIAYRAQADEEQWGRKPNSMSSNWKEGLTPHLSSFRETWARVGPRIRDEDVRQAVQRFDAAGMAAEVNAAQDQRNSRQDQGSIDAARDVTRRVLEETQRLRAALHDAM
jgi:hypothetical protein